MTYHIYTDGGARGNGKDADCVCGGGVYIEELNYKWCDSFKFLEGNTNQKAELAAAIWGLNAIHKYFRENPKDVGEVIVYSDSAYVVNGMNDWIKGWLRNNWINSKKEPVKNKELWENLLDARERIEKDFFYGLPAVTFEKVKGHADNKGNQIADALVNIAMDRAGVE